MFTTTTWEHSRIKIKQFVHYFQAVSYAKQQNNELNVHHEIAFKYLLLRLSSTTAASFILRL